MTEQAFLMVLFTLSGLGWTIGSLLQWLTLRKQEKLIQELERYHRLTVDRELDDRRFGDFHYRHSSD